MIPIDQDLVGLLIDSVVDDAALTELTRHLAGLLAATGLVFQVRDGTEAEVSMPYGLDEVIGPYSEHFWRIDPWVSDYRGGAHRVVVFQEIVSDEQFDRSEIYNDLLRSRGDIFNGVGFLAPLEGGRQFMMSALRSRARGAFTSEEARSLQAIEPALVRMVEARRRHLRGSGRLAEALADADEDALFIVASDMTVHFRNRAAARLCESAAARVQAGRLVFSETEDDHALRRGVRTAAAGRGGCALPLAARAPGLLAEIDALDGKGSATGLIRLRLVDPVARMERMVARLTARFGLTAAEAALARSLAEGRSPAEHAARRGVAIATVRSQAQGLLRKTGAAGQVELLAAMRGLAR